MGLVLRDCRIVNAVRCVPPANLPVPEEVRTCKPVSSWPKLAAMPEIEGSNRARPVGPMPPVVRHISACPQSRYKFRHGAFPRHAPGGLLLGNSYHVLPATNTKTPGGLTEAMF